MAYKYENNGTGSKDIVIDGWENGIALSPYKGIANMRNVGTSYYPGVAYVNYRRRLATLSGTGFFYAGSHSTNVGNNNNWIFTDAPATPTMGVPIQSATSPVGLNYILDDVGQIWKQSAVNSSTFTLLEGGAGRLGDGNGGLAYWNDYLVVFGDGLVEFCGDGTGDAGVISTNWNASGSGEALNTTTFSTDFMVDDTQLLITNLANFPKFQINDPVTFTTTGALPSGLTVGTTYYILSVNYIAGFITVSTTVGGSAVTVGDDGSGTQTITDNAKPVPIGNYTSLDISYGTSGTIGSTSATINSYVDPYGTTIDDTWNGPNGTFNIASSGSPVKLPAVFTNGSPTITFLSPIVFNPTGTKTIEFLDPDVTNFKAYVSKVDGNLYFANGRYLGRILAENANLVFNPGLPASYDVNFGTTALLETSDSIVDMIDLKSSLILAGNKDLYVWDYVSSNVQAPAPVGEQIVHIENILNNIYVTTNQKGNIYVSNGYSAQLLYKLPDFIAGVIDPIWTMGGIMVHRAKLYFQALASSTSGTPLLQGVFSLNVSATFLQQESASGMVMESQNSFGLIPSTTEGRGVLIDNEPSSSGQDSYYSAWGSGASATGGIDYNDTSLWQNFEALIESDMIPAGDLVGAQQLSYGNVEFKLDRPMVSGDQIRLSWRPTLTDSYTLIGTTSTATISAYYLSNIAQAQWIQFLVEFSCASSGSSFIPLREIRLHLSSDD